MSKKIILPAIIIILFLSGCDLTPDADGGISTDGIVIYTGREILNDRRIEIVTNRVQQLYATVPSGHIIEWISENPDFIEVSNNGIIRTSRTPNREVIIRAVSVNNPDIQAKVTFIIRALR